ncbi:hypothetical protein ACWERV_23230 [Streptomyces sp. NPDC004031]
MPSRDNIPGQRHPEPRYLPVPLAKPRPKQPRFAVIRSRWTSSWRDGFLHDRWEDLRQAPELGWHGMANWLKAFLAVAGASVVVLLFNGAVDIVLNALHQLLTAAPRVQVGTDTSHGVFAVVDQPVRTYIAAHCTGLQISASTVYTLWQVVGLFGLIGGAFRSTGARLTWTAWGAASIAMVHAAAPTGGRTIATGLAILAWTAASALALRGLSLRPVLFTHIHNAAPAFEPHIHLPTPAAPLADDDAPDNVHTHRMH